MYSAVLWLIRQPLLSSSAFRGSLQSPAAVSSTRVHRLLRFKKHVDLHSFDKRLQKRFRAHGYVEVLTTRSTRMHPCIRESQVHVVSKAATDVSSLAVVHILFQVARPGNSHERDGLAAIYMERERLNMSTLYSAYHVALRQMSNVLMIPRWLDDAPMDTEWSCPMRSLSSKVPQECRHHAAQAQSSVPRLTQTRS
jgi:hypothetical protein